jgi:predicted MPP superfamily phosphohydrolase
MPYMEAEAIPEKSHQRRPARLLVLVPVLGIFSAVMVGGHWYLASRLIVAPALPEAVTQALLAIVVVLASTLILQPFSERFFPEAVARWVAWPASLWMGVAFLLLMALLVSEGLMVLIAAGVGDTAGPEAARFRAIAVVLLVLPTAAVALREGLALPRVRRVEIALARWPAALDGLRLVQISDIHFGPLRGAEFAAWLKDEINGLQPDLIAITGDLVDGPVSKLRDAVTPFAELRSTHGAFFVTGNHDHYSGAQNWAERVRELGIRVLRNECVALAIDGETVQLAGTDDHRSRHMPGDEGEDLDRALAGADPQLPLILLAHDPSTFKEAHARDVDLQLSGHTHGGQIWPFNYFVKLAVPFVAGLYRKGPGTLYVSRGTGYWGPPMRLRAPAEITEIILRRG